MYPTLKLYRPTISKNLTQGWGENLACINNSTGRIFGVSKACPAGSMSYYIYIGMNGHNGIDIGGLIGADILHCATFSGWMRTEVDPSGGIGVDVVSNEPLFFKGPVPKELRNTAVVYVQKDVVGFLHHVKMRYWHLHSTVGFDKKAINPGMVVGLLGNTGASSAPHLHFAPKWCNKDGYSIAEENGFNGAFDPTPYYQHNVFIGDHVKYLNQKPLPLSPQETQDILAKLSTVQLSLVTLQKLIHKL